MIVLTRLDGTVIAANPATTRITGYSEAELVGRPLWEYLLTGGQREDATEFFATQQLPRTGEAKLQTKNGQQLAVMYSSDVHQASADAPVTVVLSATDVTDARQNAGMVNHLLRSARTIAFVGTDLGGRITLFNTGAEHMLGISAEMATGRELVDFIAAEGARTTFDEPGRPLCRRSDTGDAGLHLAPRRAPAAERLDDDQPRHRHLRGPLRLPVRRQ